MPTIRAISSGSLASGSSLVLTPTGVSDTSTVDHIVLPTGSTANRPASAASGSLRFNTDTGLLEYFDGTAWRVVPEERFRSLYFARSGGPALFPSGGGFLLINAPIILPSWATTTVTGVRITTPGTYLFVARICILSTTRHQWSAVVKWRNPSTSTDYMTTTAASDLLINTGADHYPITFEMPMLRSVTATPEDYSIFVDPLGFGDVGPWTNDSVANTITVRQL